MNKILIALCTAVFFSSNAHGFTLSNFDSPESIQTEPENGSYYVSNINGGFTEKDGNGYISKISSSGNVVIQKFIGGRVEDAALNAPKGLALAGGHLIVADIDALKIFDKVTQKLVATIDLSKQGAKFLNDVTLDSTGMIYASDTMSDIIFKINPKKNYEAAVFKSGRELGQPNGMVMNPKNRNLIVVTWGSGQILEIDPSGKIHVLKRGLSTLDGVDYDTQGNLYVSNFDRGEIYRITRFGRGQLSTYASGLTSPADISFDRSRDELLIPSMKMRTVTSLRRKY